MKAGRPGTSIPTPVTVARDVKLSFEQCREHIDKILKVSFISYPCLMLTILIHLQEHSGRIHIATDAWTSPNHCAFVAWTVHLHHEGHLLAFVLDIMEVPEVRLLVRTMYSTNVHLSVLQPHTGEALAQAFHDMLAKHGLSNKVRQINTYICIGVWSSTSRFSHSLETMPLQTTNKQSSSISFPTPLMLPIVFGVLITPSNSLPRHYLNHSMHHQRTTTTT